jgi:predicted glutamine amidotransferase
MCRLAGYVCTDPSTAFAMLGPSAAKFRDLGRRNPHGWGVAFHEPGSPTLHRIRESSPIDTSTVFEAFASVRPVQNMIMHMRDATPGLPVVLRNTHPFTGGGLAFAHNGAISVAGLDELLPADAVLEGDTDSERYFALVADGMSRGETAARAMRSAVLAIIEAGLTYTALNAVLLTPAELVAICQFDPASRPDGQAAAQFTLRLDVRDGLVGVVSGGWEGAPPTRLANGTLVRIDLGTAAVYFEDVAGTSSQCLIG